MNDLVTWLRAQLDEDEQWAGDVADRSWEEQRFTQARALAEVEAKRRILAEFEKPDVSVEYGDGLWAAISALALPYADRPGYREGWRP